MKKKMYIVLPLLIELLLISLMLLQNSRKEQIRYSFAQEQLQDSENIQESLYYLQGSGDINRNIMTPEIILPRGVYRITVEYELNGAGKIYAQYGDGNYTDQVGGFLGLDKMTNQFSYDLRIDRNNSPVRIYARLTNDATDDYYLLVRSMEITRSGIEPAYVFFQAFLFFLVLDVLALILYQRKKIWEAFNRVTWQQGFIFWGLFFTTVLVSLPFMTEYLILGHDSAFHLTRIDGIREGLLSGQFPVRIQPGWMNDHGYATSVFYGEIFLYIPAILRIFGLPLGRAYSLFAIAVNGATVLTGYYCFKRISGSAKIGFIVTVFYSANLYRLTAMHMRSAVGMYTAMIFYPLVVYGLHKIFTENIQDKDYKKNYLILCLGYTGILMSHTISTMLAAGYTAIVCLILWKKTFRKETFLLLVKTVVVFIALNLWFLVPFLDYMRYEWVANTYDEAKVVADFMEKRVFLPQFFTTQYNVLGYDLEYAKGMAGDMPLNLGIASGLILAAGIMVVRRWGKREYFMYALILGSIFAASTFFPWDKVCKAVPLFKSVIRSMQFPWRLNAVIVVMCGYLLCVIGMGIKENRILQNTLLMVIAVVACLQGLDFESRVLNECKGEAVYELGAGRFSQQGGEYLPNHAETDKFVRGITQKGQMVEIQSWDMDYNSVTAVLTNHSENTETIEVPLLYYPGYKAVDDSTGEGLVMQAEASGRAGVELPGNYSGRLQVDFYLPWYWRLSEVFSLIVIAGLLYKHMIRNSRFVQAGRWGKGRV